MFAQTTSNASRMPNLFQFLSGGPCGGQFWPRLDGGQTQRNPCLPATPGSFQRNMPNANGSGFVAKFDTNKSPATAVVYATYLGGSANTSGANSVGIDSTR